MKRNLYLGMVAVFLLSSTALWADNTTPVPNSIAVSASSTPAAPVKKKRKKKNATATATTTATVQATPSTPTTAAPTPQASSTPMAKAKASPTPTAVPTVTGSNSSLTGDQAYFAKDYAKAAEAYADAIQKQGKSPELEKKLLLSKFYAGQALEDEARKGLKQEENYIKSDEESHNLAVYGKKEPTRGVHLVTLSLAFLTPQLAGGDIGFTFLSHWNVGLGIGFMGVDPRIKYYFDGDNASFFLGAGFATYNFNLNGNLNVGGGNGSFSGTLSGTFFHFTLGPSFQDKDGTFMEIPFDFGIANFTGNGNANGGTSGGGGGSSGGSGSGSYNGPFGILGFRVGYSI